MSFLSGGDWAGLGAPDRGAGGDQVQERRRRAARDGLLGIGTIACARCDAPVGIGPGPIAVTGTLTCPYCGHHGAAREFLSLRPPTRPTRVEVRVALRDRG